MSSLSLNELSASNIFDLRGVVAVVTGGGTVSTRESRKCEIIELIDLFWVDIGNRANDQFYSGHQRRHRLHRWAQTG